MIDGLFTKQNRLAQRLIASLLLVSTCLSIGATAIQLSVGFQRDKQDILETFRLLSTSFQTSLENALWQFNYDQIEAILNGINTNPNVARISLEAETGKSWLLGLPTIGDDWATQTVILTKEKQSGVSEIIGDLQVWLTLKSAKSRVWSQFWTIFLSNLLKTLLASTIMLYLMHTLITRHLRRTAQFLNETEWTPSKLKEVNKLILNRRVNEEPDDLDNIVLGINIAREQIRLALTKLEHEVEQHQLTENKIAEQNLNLQKLNEELARSNSDLDDFAYIASHDLKEPLRAISTHSTFLLEDYENVLEGDGKKRLFRLQELTKKMEQLIADLMYYSRIGRSKANPQTLIVSDIIASIEVELQDYIGSRNGSVSLKQPVPTIQANTGQISTVFRNLIINGLKYNESDCPTVEIGYCTAQNINTLLDVEAFYVRDNGIGIDAKFHTDVFTIFKRLNSEKKYGPGTGASLSFVEKIIHNHNGDIWIDSQPGEGTTVYFTVPAIKTIQSPKLPQ